MGLSSSRSARRVHRLLGRPAQLSDFGDESGETPGRLNILGPAGRHHPPAFGRAPPIGGVEELRLSLLGKFTGQVGMEHEVLQGRSVGPG